MRNVLIILSVLILSSVTFAENDADLSINALSSKKFNGRDLKLVKMLEKNKAYTRHYIEYKSGGLKISGIMNIPAGKGPFPVIITCHGYIEPKVYTNGRGLKREQDYFAKRGYVVLHPDYRNHNGSDKVEAGPLSNHMGYTEDVVNAVYALKSSALAFIDKESIGVLGHSMGGLIALNMMVAKPGLVKAYVLYAPMSSDYRDNFNRWILRRGERKYGDRSAAQKIIEMYGSPESNPAFWEGLSAKNYFSNVTEPVLLFHGTSDSSVPVDWSYRLESMLKQKGRDISVRYYTGEKHEFIRKWPDFMAWTVKFFDAHLK